MKETGIIKWSLWEISESIVPEVLILTQIIYNILALLIWNCFQKHLCMTYQKVVA